MSKYRHLEKEGIRVGKRLSYTVREGLSGEKASPSEEKVEGFAGGGFFGSIILLPEKVIKTAQPDPFHDFLREINWPIPFPSRSNETAARLDYLSGKICHLIVSEVTHHEIITPQALGYTHLSPNIGYGQVLERMWQRGPTFADGGAENARIKAARQQVWAIGKKFGLEQAAQVHLENPFGKPNMKLSTNEDDQMIWLDTLPAFRHTEYVRPFFRFPFHAAVRQAMGVSEVTYNRIHTKKVRAVLEAEPRLFKPAVKKNLEEMLDEYDRLYEEYSEWSKQPLKKLWAEDALNRGLLTSEAADSVANSEWAYRMFRLTQLTGLGTHALLHVIENSPVGFLWDKELPEKIKKFVKDPVYRNEQILERSVLWGMKQAVEDGSVTQEELRTALEFVPEEELRTYLALQLWYVLYSRISDVLILPVTAVAAAAFPPAEAAALVSAFALFGPGIVRSISTLMTQQMTKVELKKAALLSLIPSVGGYTAIGFQLKDAYGDQAEKITHHTLRALVATLTQLRPGGGWGSDLEEEVWTAVFGRKAKQQQLQQALKE